MRTISRNRRRLGPVGVSAVLAAGLAAAVLPGLSDSAEAEAACRDTNVPPTVEEARLDRTLGDGTDPVGLGIVADGGFAGLVEEFAGALCGAADAAAAEATADRFGRSLWTAAVERAQGPDPSEALPANDDRPLYWTRLAMARELRQFKPGFAATESQRAAWQKRFEYASRGLTTSDFAPSSAGRKLFVSGFDPFQLDDEIRRGNPSGAAVLRLDGKVLRAGGADVEIQVVVLPVRFQDFTDGIVEDAFGPHVAAGPQGADMFTTISQGRFGQFDLEAFNGRRRSTTFPDNVDVSGGGQEFAPVVPPGMGPGPEFIASTLPMEPMRAVDGDFPILVNTEVREIPAGEDQPVWRPDGPTDGSIAVDGGGGGYLSNESAYRVTRLVREAGRAVPAGHLHVPVLEFDGGNSTEVSDPVLTANRTAIATQTERILLAGAAPR